MIAFSYMHMNSNTGGLYRNSSSKRSQDDSVFVTRSVGLSSSRDDGAASAAAREELSRRRFARPGVVMRVSHQLPQLVQARTHDASVRAGDRPAYLRHASRKQLAASLQNVVNVLLNVFVTQEVTVPVLAFEAAGEATPDGHLVVGVSRLYAQFIHARLAGVREDGACAVALVIAAARSPRLLTSCWQRVAKRLLPATPVQLTQELTIGDVFAQRASCDGQLLAAGRWRSCSG